MSIFKKKPEWKAEINFFFIFFLLQFSVPKVTDLFVMLLFGCFNWILLVSFYDMSAYMHYSNLTVKSKGHLNKKNYLLCHVRNWGFVTSGEAKRKEKNSKLQSNNRSSNHPDSHWIHTTQFSVVMGIYWKILSLILQLGQNLLFQYPVELKFLEWQNSKSGNSFCSKFREYTLFCSN